MKTYNATITTDNGATVQQVKTAAPDYTKAYLNIIRAYLNVNIIIIELKEI